MKKKWTVAAGMAILLFLAANVVFAADEIRIFIHGKEIGTDVPAKIENGTTMVPLRAIAEKLNQDVGWDQKTQTVTIEPKKVQSSIERLVAQRNRDVIVSDDPENAKRGHDANLALIYNLETVYNEIYRGFLNPDPDAANGEIKTDKDFSLFSGSLAATEGSVEENVNYLRLVQTPYVRKLGQNEPSRKDVIFYTDAANADDLYMAVQNPEALTEWRVYPARNYGNWFIQQLNIYFQGARGLYEEDDAANANLTDHEAKQILEELLPKAETISEGVFNGSGWFKEDATKTIPGEADYWLANGERWKSEFDMSHVKSIADLKKIVAEVYTQDVAEEMIYNRYLTPHEGARPLYKEYEGALYVDTRNGGHGWSTRFLMDTVKIRYQKDHVADIAIDTTVLDEPYGTLRLKIKDVNGKWMMASGLYDYESYVELD